MLNMDKEYSTTTFCFSDETGLLNSPRDRFFAVGMIKIAKPHELYLQMKILRDKLKYYDELKWSGIYTKNVPVINKFVDLFFSYEHAKFSCYVFRKTELDLLKHFKGDLFEAYQAFSAMQIQSNLTKSESVFLIMDDLSTPSTTHLEVNIRRRVNRKLQRNAVYGICRLYSKGVELIQLTDVLLGAVAYDFKVNEGLITGPGLAKKDVLKHIRKRAGVKTLATDTRTKNIDIWTFKTK